MTITSDELYTVQSYNVGSNDYILFKINGTYEEPMITTDNYITYDFDVILIIICANSELNITTELKKDITLPECSGENGLTYAGAIKNFEFITGNRLEYKNKQND